MKSHLTGRKSSTVDLLQLRVSGLFPPHHRLHTPDLLFYGKTFFNFFNDSIYIDSVETCSQPKDAALRSMLAVLKWCQNLNAVRKCSCMFSHHYESETAVSDDDDDDKLCYRRQEAAQTTIQCWSGELELNYLQLPKSQHATTLFKPPFSATLVWFQNSWWFSCCGEQGADETNDKLLFDSRVRVGEQMNFSLQLLSPGALCVLTPASPEQL